jgi:hypothetical protein
VAGSDICARRDVIRLEEVGLVSDAFDDDDFEDLAFCTTEAPKSWTFAHDLRKDLPNKKVCSRQKGLVNLELVTADAWSNAFENGMSGDISIYSG